MYNKKALSKAKAELDKAKAPKKPKDIITDPMGQWKYPGLPTRIPGNDITMEGVGYPVLGVANNGQRKIMLPGADYTFPGADYVDEYPQMKRGGTRKRRKTKSLSGTNELMLPHPLLRNYKNRVYDPNVDYFQDGGYIEAELTDDEIEEYRKGGYIVEDISVPELNQARKGKIVNTNQLPKPSVYIAKNDKDYAFRKKAYDDSLAIYNLDKDYSNLSLKAAKLINDPNSDESKYFDIQDKLKKNYSEQYKILKNSNVPHKLIPIKERIKGDRAMMHPKPTQTIVKPYKQEADKTKENSKFITNKSKEKILEISDPAEYAYRKRMYEDSLNSYNTGKKVYTNVGEIFEKLNPGGEYINNNFLSFYQNPDKKPNYGTNSKGVSPKGYGKKFRQDLSRIYFSTPAEKKAWYNVAKNLSELDNLNTKPIRTINQAEIPTLFVYKKPTQKVVLKTENKPVQDTIIQKPVVQQEVKPIIQQNIKPVQKINYPEGYQPYSLYGRLLDPEVYGYGESINNKPVELAQGADMMLKKMQMEKYKKSGKYPWSKQNGGLIEAQTGGIKTHKSKDGTVTNTITKPNGDTVIQVKTKDGKYYEKVNKGLPQFVKDEFKKRAEWEDRSSGAAQPVDEFWTLPIGMTSAGVKGTVGLAKGLTSLGRNALKSSLVQAGKTGTKAIFNTAPKWAPGMTLGNGLNATFAGLGINELIDPNSTVRKATKKAIDNPTADNIGNATAEHIWNGLNFMGLGVTGELINGAKSLNKVPKNIISTLSKNKIKTPAGFKNRVFPSNIQLGTFKGEGHLSEPGYNYRTLGNDEIEAIKNIKGVFPKSGKAKGGNENVKYWTEGNNKNWYADNSSQNVIRVNKKNFSNDKIIHANDVEIYNHSTKQFEPIIKNVPKQWNIFDKTLNKKKQGGAINDAVYVDLTDDEIQDYIKQGYIVEDIE